MSSGALGKPSALVDTSAMKRPNLVRSVFPVKDATLESFDLSAAELLEVEAVRLELEHYSLSELEELTRTTTNAGVQYVLLNNASLVLDVLDSRNLNPKVIPPFLKRMENFKAAPLPFDGSRAIYFLLLNKLVVADVKIFKQVWSTAEVMRSSFRSKKTLVHHSLLYATLNGHSRPKKGRADVIPIETLLFIFTYLSKHEDGMTPPLKGLQEQIIDARREEIQAWVKVNMPDCEGLPLSWVYKVFDLYQVT